MLAYKPVSAVECLGRVWRLNVQFDVVLRTYDLQKDPLFTPSEKLQMMMRMFVKWYDRWRVRRLSDEQLAQLYQTIAEQCLTVKSRPSNDNRKSFDFKQDASLIYASFWQAYHIDLHVTKPHWQEFIALFQGLPQSTKIKEVMDIRLRDIPLPDKHNAKHVRKLQEAKAYWALEVDPEEAARTFQEGVDALTSKLVMWAKAAERKPDGPNTIPKGGVSGVPSKVDGSSGDATHENQVSATELRSDYRDENTE